MRCPVCSTEAESEALFCAHCGARLPQHAGAAASAAEPAIPKPAPAPEAPAPGPKRRGVTDVPEETLWEGSYSPKALLGTLVACGLASIVLVIAAAWMSRAAASGVWLAPLVLIALVWITVAGRFAARRLGIHYRLTNQMFYHQRGVMTRVTDRIEVIGIDDVTYIQGLLERAVNVGNIKLRSSDPTNPEFTLEGVEQVQDVARLIDKARRAERLRRGMSVESLSITQPGADAGASASS